MVSQQLLLEIINDVYIFDDSCCFIVFVISMLSLEKFTEDYRVFSKMLYDSSIHDLFVDLQVSKDGIDHVARRAATLESYQELTQLLREERPTFFYESIVNDRPIAIVALKQELLLEDYKINIIEIISPKPNKST